MDSYEKEKRMAEDRAKWRSIVVSLLSEDVT